MGVLQSTVQSTKCHCVSKKNAARYARLRLGKFGVEQICLGCTSVQLTHVWQVSALK